MFLHFLRLKLDNRLECPKISIVTPSFNQGKFLEATIRSVLLQGYPKLDYIIIDGGSTDNSVEIIKRYEPWLSYWVSEPDHGQAEAINKGFRNATGEIFAWLNSDDLYARGALNKIGNYFLDHPEVDLTYGGCTYISENDLIIKKPQICPFHKDELFIRNLIAQPSTFFRKHLFRAVGPLNESLDLCFDTELWRKAALKFNIKNNHHYLSYFRFHSESKSVSFSLKMMKESAEITKDILESANELDQNLKQILRFRYLQLAILNWKIDPNNVIKINNYLSKAAVSCDLFVNKYIQRLFFAFVNQTYMDYKSMDRIKIKNLADDIKNFSATYLSPLLPDGSDRHTNTIISHSYFMLSIRLKNFPLLVKGFTLSPLYSLQFTRQILFETKQLFSGWFKCQINNFP